MPFDAATENDPAAMYMERRQRAWDEVWSKVPPEKFYINMWKCGSVACAAGWLGVAGHNGWTILYENVVAYPSCGSDNPWKDLADYFGLPGRSVFKCFGGTEDRDVVFGTATPALIDVYRVLMAAPVMVPDLVITDGVA